MRVEWTGSLNVTLPTLDPIGTWLCIIVFFAISAISNAFVEISMFLKSSKVHTAEIVILVPTYFRNNYERTAVIMTLL